MQDAIALHQGLLQHPGDARAAFAVFEAQRRPASSNFQAAAAAGLVQNVADKMHLDPVDFAYDYMRRTGRSATTTAQRDPASPRPEARRPVTA